MFKVNILRVRGFLMTWLLEPRSKKGYFPE